MYMSGEVVYWKALAAEETIDCNTVLAEVQQRCCLPLEEYMVRLFTTDGWRVPETDAMRGEYSLVVERNPIFEKDYLTDANGDVLPLWVHNLPGCSKLGFLAYLDINTALEARIELPEIKL